MVVKRHEAIIWINGTFHLTAGTIWDTPYSNVEIKKVLLSCVVCDLALSFTLHPA